MGFISAGLFGVYSGSAYLDVISQSHSGSQVRSIDTSTDSKGSTYDAGHFIISPRGQGFLIRSAPVAIYVALANTMYATGLPQRMTDLTLSSVQKIGFNARTKNFVARCLPYSSEAYSFLKFYGRSILSVAKEGAMRNRITGELPRDFIERTFPEIAAAFDVSKLTAAQPLANFAEEYTGSFPQNTLVGVVVTPFAFACRVISEPDVCRVESEIWEFLSRDDYDLSEKSNWEVLKDMSGVIGSAIGHALGQAFGEGYRWGRDLSSMLLQSYSVNLFMLIVSFLPVCRGTIRPVLIRVFRDGAVAMRKLRSKCNHHLRRRYNVPQIIQGDLSRLRPQRKVENDNQGQKHREGTAPFLETREEGFIEENVPFL
ncbi:hypothetical protein N7470_010207 [Penicillium chermesinum]|nr:hypothetical protein N7470_010207 [Penicillium chermesinum]